MPFIAASSPSGFSYQTCFVPQARSFAEGRSFAWDAQGFALASRRGRPNPWSLAWFRVRGPCWSFNPAVWHNQAGTHSCSPSAKQMPQNLALLSDKYSIPAISPALDPIPAIDPALDIPRCHLDPVSLRSHERSTELSLLPLFPMDSSTHAPAHTFAPASALRGSAPISKWTALGVSRVTTASTKSCSLTASDQVDLSPWVSHASDRDSGHVVMVVMVVGLILLSKSGSLFRSEKSVVTSKQELNESR